MRSPTTKSGVLVTAIGLAIAAPWMLHSGWLSGPYAPWPSPDLESAPAARWMGSLIAAMPATIVLALYGLWKALCDCLRGGEGAAHAELPLLWALVACLALGATHPTSSALLFALVPMTILAVRALQAILQRQVRDRTVLVLMVLTVISFFAVQSEALGELPAWLARAERPSDRRLLRLHLALDVILVACAVLVWLYTITARDDRWRRRLFGAFVLLTILGSCLPGWWQLERRRHHDDPWLTFYRRLLLQRDIDAVVLVGGARPEPRLEFVTRTLFPEAGMRQARSRTEVEPLLNEIGGRPVVIVTDPTQRLPTSLRVARADSAMVLSLIYDSDPRGAGDQPGPAAADRAVTVVAAYAPAKDLKP